MVVQRQCGVFVPDRRERIIVRFASAEQLAETQEARKDEVKRMAMEEHADFVARMREEHFHLVSGNVSAKTLRALDHPFARRHLSGLDLGAKKARRKNLMGAANVRVLPINVQGGQLRRSLYVQYKTPEENEIQAFEVGFAAPHAKYVLAKRGTKRMIARQFQEVKKKIETKRKRELAQRIRIGIVRIHANNKGGSA